MQFCIIIADELVRLRAIDQCRAAILGSIEEQGKLTGELRERILKGMRVVYEER